MAGNIETELHSYIGLLNAAQKKTLLRFLKTVMMVPGEEITVEQYNKELDAADAAIERGEFCTHEEATKLIREQIGAAKASKRS